jgi:hypothetical protein
MSEETRGDSKETPRLLWKVSRKLTSASTLSSTQSMISVCYCSLWIVDCGLCTVGTDKCVYTGIFSGLIARQRSSVIVSVFIYLQLVLVLMLECQSLVSLSIQVLKRVLPWQYQGMNCDPVRIGNVKYRQYDSYTEVKLFRGSVRVNYWINIF